MVRRSIVAAAVAAMLLIPSLPAYAQAPHQQTYESDFVLKIGCRGFTLMDQVHTTFRIQRFFAPDGTVARTTIHNRWTGVITNKTTGEFVASDPGYWQDTLVGHVVTTRGLLYGIKIASLGIFIQGVGKIVTNLRTGEVLFQSSTDDHHQDYGDLCAALS